MSIIVQQDATIYSLSRFCKLLALHVSGGNSHPSLGAHNCNYSTWHWSNRLCRDGSTSARCCDYSYMCSWRWVELPLETCGVSSLQKYNKLYIVASCWTIIDSENDTSSTLKMEARRSYKTLLPIYLTTWYQMPDNCNIHNYDNLTSHTQQ